MHISEEVADWIDEMGLEIVIAKHRTDLKRQGLHLVNPSIADLVIGCYEVIEAESNVIVLHILPMAG